MLLRKVKCYQCGSHNHSDTEFCQNCGSVLYVRKEPPQGRYSDIIYHNVFYH